MFGTKEEIMVKNALDILESVGILKIWASHLQLPSHDLLRGVDAVEKEAQARILRPFGEKLFEEGLVHIERQLRASPHLDFQASIGVIDLDAFVGSPFTGKETVREWLRKRAVKTNEKEDANGIWD